MKKRTIKNTEKYALSRSGMQRTEEWEYEITENIIKKVSTLLTLFLFGEKR